MNIHGLDLQPLDPALAAVWQNEMGEMAEPIRGGLISPPVEGCQHAWELFPLLNMPLRLSKCKKCHVLGVPP